ncbi:negative regulator of sigma-X activity [Bacillus methanolicus]|uniref:negative regulator of sigma-X activity n=1 Tax=Bacillus methanolicus TaxID=1471 RepID=UPI0023805A2C|nr:negative regulator of sigma-X activity [Bacillus methanolicus]MDE3839444.1 negative regulator of sigma-X activity [Bacillus methanolicus]
MKKSVWTDKELEELLLQLPKISDNRDPRDIYQNIALKTKKRKRQIWIMPSLAAAAAVVLFIILSPNLINWQEPPEQKISLNSATSKENMEMVRNDNTAAIEDNNKDVSIQEENPVNFEDGSNNQSSEKTLADDVERTAVYKEDLQGKELLTYAIPDANGQNIVPVSVLVQKEDNKSWFDQFKETMADLKEEEWGLSEYYPLHADLAYDSLKKVLNIDVPRDHQYGFGSANEIMFKSSLLGSFADGDKVDKITFTTENEKGIVLGNDEITELVVEKSNSSAHGYLFLYPAKGKKPFIVPTPDEYKTIHEAFVAMRKEFATHQLKPSISEGLQFEKVVPNNNGILSIFLTKSSNVNDLQEMVYSIEAILLTAKNFGFKAVKVENPPVKNIGQFDFSKELQVPVAANKLSIE